MSPVEALAQPVEIGQAGRLIIRHAELV